MYKYSRSAWGRVWITTIYAAIFAAVLMTMVLGTGCKSLNLIGSGNNGSPAAIKVMTYNIHHGAGMDGKLDLERIASVIRRESPDLVCLNEVDNNYSSRSRFKNEAKEIANILGMYYVYGPAINTRGKTPGAKPHQYGDAVLSRFPIISSRVYHLSTAKGLEPRVCVAVKVQPKGTNGREYTFMATHLEHHVSQDTMRVKQVKDIMKVVGLSPRRTILAGDFNCQPPGAMVNNVKLPSEKTQAVALVLRTLKSSANKKQLKLDTIRDGVHIDYIFISGDLKASNYRIIKDKLTELASDHYPVVAVIHTVSKK